MDTKDLRAEITRLHQLGDQLQTQTTNMTKKIYSVIRTLDRIRAEYDSASAVTEDNN